MKVLFLSPKKEIGGILAYSQEVIAALKDVKDVSLKLSDYSKVTPSSGYDVLHIQHHYSFFGKPYPFLNGFRRYIKGVKTPIVVTVHDTITCSPAPLPKGLLTIANLAIRILNWQTFNNSKIDRFIVHSERQKPILRGFGVPEEKIVVIPLGVPLSKHSRSAREIVELKRKWNLEGKEVLSILGFIYRRKGYEVAIEALKRIKNKSVVLLIAGDTHPQSSVDREYKMELCRLIEKEKLTEQVRITGYLSDHQFEEVVALTDIILAPFEENYGSPYSLATAIGFNKPIIASDIEPVREVNNRLKCLEIFSVGNDRQLAKKIVSLSSRPYLRRELIEATNSYSKKYSFSNLAREQLRIYHQLIGQS